MQAPFTVALSFGVLEELGLVSSSSPPPIPLPLLPQTAFPATRRPEVPSKFCPRSEHTGNRSPPNNNTVHHNSTVHTADTRISSTPSTRPGSCGGSRDVSAGCPRPVDVPSSPVSMVKWGLVRGTSGDMIGQRGKLIQSGNTQL